MEHPRDRLRYHVTGAIERGEAKAIEAVENTTPQPEDYIISPTGRLGSQVSLGVVDGPYLGTFQDEYSALVAAQSRMESEAFWPDVWWIDDHGGTSRIY